ncbi:MAG TPA: homospermidine synthase [Lentisphaeria bacterium]|nr:MAG: homospermidine synthase [Lentisphaerae bacterium GWF2_38_69]HBM15996.1 homospermidine synthase [Lentisphaeria bacterium]
MKKTKFSGKILVIGCGSVSRCTLPLLLKHIDINPKKITVIDFADCREYISDSIQTGVNYDIVKITPENMHSVLSKYTSSGDMIVDLAWNIDCCEIMQWCHNHDVKYVNTSVEVWNPYDNKKYKTPQSKTLYARHMAIRKMTASWHVKGPSMIVEHGANPGLVSHFTKMALKDIAEKIITEKPDDERSKILPDLISKGDYPNIAKLSGTKVIHISERDMQITNKPKETNEFVNTWSIEGLYEEGIAPAEMGWGTHEMELPNNVFLHNEGPMNQICLEQCGIRTKVHSWVPAGEIIGFMVRHGEAFTISDYLTVWEENKAVYRPTVHYAYCCSDSTIASLHELEMRNFNLQPKLRIMTDEIISGKDELGVLLMGHDFKSWWCGSLLDINDARSLLPHQNATTLQVAASVLAAVLWMIKNPSEGFHVPDELPYEEILGYARPYLGPVVSLQSDWTPMKDRKEFFRNYDFESDDNSKQNGDIEWQFKDFLV